MAWLPISPDKLCIGLYIKIDHGWMEHPFVRQTFVISSPTEISIVRKHALTHLFYDPDKSQPAALQWLQADHQPPDAAINEDDVLQDETALRKEKAAHIQQIVDHRSALTHAEQHYGRGVQSCVSILSGVRAGKRASIDKAKELIATMQNLTESHSAALTLVRHAQGENESRLASEAMNVTALAYLTGKTLKLTPDDAACLGLGALFHNIGKHVLPAALHEKKLADLSAAEQRLLRWHPEVGKDLLQRLGGLSSDVTDIVAHHQERLDGSGHPRGLSNGSLSRLTRIVGSISHYHGLTEDPMGGLTPTQALSCLYQQRESTFGSDTIEPFIATITVYPPGAFVELSDGHMACVVKINPDDRLRPVVMLYEPEHSYETAAVIDLARERALSIQRSLDPGTMPPEALKALANHSARGFILA